MIIFAIIGLAMILVGVICATCAEDVKCKRGFIFSAIVAAWGFVIVAAVAVSCLIKHF